MASKKEESIGDISSELVVVRGRRVALDSTLAKLYGITTRRLNEQVRRNRGRFPDDFLLELTTQEFSILKSQFATSSWGGRRKPPFAFTEHGAIMAATILNSQRAVQMSVYVVRAFVALRDFMASHSDLAQKLERLERSLIALDLSTERKFAAVYEAIRALRAVPAPRKAAIGFTRDPSEDP